MSHPDNTADQQRGHLFQPGQSGNPAGRPKGSKNRLGEAFIKALADDFDEHGVQAIQTVREEKPDQYLKVIASLMPKEMNLNINEVEALSDDELLERMKQLYETIGPIIGYGEIGGMPEGMDKTRAH